MEKTKLRILLLQNHWANSLESRYVVFGTLELHIKKHIKIITPYLPWPIYNNVKFATLGFWMGKTEIFLFFSFLSFFLLWVDLDLFHGKVKFGPLGFWMCKGEIVHFSVAIKVCDMEMLRTSTPMNAKGQGHTVTLPEGHLGLIFLLIFFFLETTRVTKIIFHKKPLWYRRMKLYSNGQDYMTKMLSCPYVYGKDL